MSRSTVRAGLAVVTAAAALAGHVAVQNWSAATQPTLTKVKTEIAASVRIKKAPNLATSIPPLEKAVTDVAPPIFMPHGKTFPSACYNDQAALPPTNAATACVWGDADASNAVLLTGDSQAGMFLPSLDTAGKILHIKVIFLAKVGCAPWGNPNPPSFVIYGSVTVAACDAWRHAVVADVPRLHISTVLLDGRAYPIGWDGDVEANLTDLESRMKAEVTAFQGAGVKVVFLSPLPSYNQILLNGLTPTSCLLSGSPVTSCEFPPSKLLDPVTVTGEEATAAATGAKIAVTTPLFCTQTKCALFVKATNGSHLVYSDQDHMNKWYAQWIGPALEQILKPLL
jgi:SGNH domain-containing protein